MNRLSFSCRFRIKLIRVISFKKQIRCYLMWLTRGHEFDSRLYRCQVTTLGKQLVRDKNWWCSAAGKVTAGLAESNDILPPFYDYTSPLCILPRDRDQLKLQHWCLIEWWNYLNFLLHSIFYLKVMPRTFEVKNPFYRTANAWEAYP